MTRISDASVQNGICARWEITLQWSVSGWCTHPGQTDFLLLAGREWVETHERSGAHWEAEKAYLMTKFCLSQDSTVIVELLEAEREQVEKNRRILQTLFLARQGLAFRGHREYAGLGAPDSNKGNFLELLKLLAHYDSILEQHMNNPVSRVNDVWAVNGAAS